MVNRQSSRVYMALILHIETATTVCSVAVAKDGELLALKEEREGYTHAEKITLFIQDALREAQKRISDLDAVAVSSGPGSYTGLRIGMSTAKGLCYALEKPLITVSTLQSLAASVINFQSPIGSRQPASDNFYFVPMIDARRMEVYCAVYDNQLKEIEKVSAKIIDENSFTELLNKNKVYFFGDGTEKCKPLLSKHSNAVFIDAVFSSAASMISLSHEKFLNEEFENVALVEPLYLKEFQDKVHNH
jgi:tRNA threonylcarbamoyladenosine biosynthesis protein TsaB